MAKRGRPPHPDILTPREWEVVELLREHLTNDEIAERLGITERGVRHHVSEILSKLGLSSRQEAAAWRPEHAERRPGGVPVLRRWAVAPIAFKIASVAIVGAAAVGVVVLAIGVLSSDDNSGSGTENNLFANPGFENQTADGESDPDPWTTLAGDAGFVISNDHAHSGSHSALLNMDDAIEDSGGKVYYLVQEITPDEFPEYIEGYYRVENWERGTGKQYVQFVVIAFGPDNFPADSLNYQIRYLLAGIDEPPFAIENAYFEFINTEEPVEGEWVKFSLPIRDDFQRLWNAVPEGYDNLRLLFEVRWDDKVEGDGAPRGDVYYDDLYIGPAP